jgi:hypothetical protein
VLRRFLLAFIPQQRFSSAALPLKIRKFCGLFSQVFGVRFSQRCAASQCGFYRKRGLWVGTLADINVWGQPGWDLPMTVYEKSPLHSSLIFR